MKFYKNKQLKILLNRVREKHFRVGSFKKIMIIKKTKIAALKIYIYIFFSF